MSPPTRRNETGEAFAGLAFRFGLRQSPVSLRGGTNHRQDAGSKRIRQEYHGNVPADVVEATAGKLGAELEQCRNLTPEHQAKGQRMAVEAIKRKAVEEMSDVAAVATKLRNDGLTLAAIADRLNAEGFVTRRGSSWSAVQVKRVLDRLDPKA
jgi:hypothetical protein